jgi:hypothetical protein
MKQICWKILAVGTVTYFVALTNLHNNDDLGGGGGGGGATIQLGCCLHVYRKCRENY